MLKQNQESKVQFVADHGQAADAAPTLEQQRQYWKYWQGTRSESQWAFERAELVLALVRGLPLDHPNILDLGCGTGWFTEKLAEFAQPTGMDLNDEAMDEARTRWPHIRFIGGTIFDHPLDAGSFDVIVSMQVIAHVEDQAAFIEKAAELLRPGGYFVVTTNNEFVMDRLGSVDWGSHRAAGHIEHWLTAKSLRRLLSSRFEILQTRTLIPMGDGGALRIVNSPRLNNLLERLFPTGYIRRFKEYLGLGYYIVSLARKRAGNTD